MKSDCKHSLLRTTVHYKPQSNRKHFMVFIVRVSGQMWCRRRLREVLGDTSWCRSDMLRAVLRCFQTLISIGLGNEVGDIRLVFKLLMKWSRKTFSYLLRLKKTQQLTQIQGGWLVWFSLTRKTQKWGLETRINNGIIYTISKRILYS